MARADLRSDGVIRALRLLPVALFVALVVLATTVTVRAGERRDQATARSAVLAAATTEVSNLVNISYQSAGHDVDRIIAGATGRLAQLVGAERAQLEVLTRDQSVTAGSVLAAGLMDLDVDRGTARVLVAADANVSNASRPQPLVKHYRWVLTLLRQHGRWLVSDAALAGVPQ